MAELMDWLLLVYKVPTEPARKRTFIWRKLKSLGAIYLQQAVALLPSRTEVEQELEALAARIREFEGEVTLLRTRSMSEVWETDVIQRFSQARDEEYREATDVARRLVDELERESAAGKFTFAELEENEEGLESLKRWLARVHERDFFDAPERPAAEEALEQLTTRLQDFAQHVYKQANQSEEESA